MSDFDTAGAAAGQAQPGWYPDPGTGQLRWWNGMEWGAFQGAPAPAAVGAGNPTGTAAMAHYLGLLGFIGPLIIMLTNNTNDPFVKDQSTEALNFHLTVLIAWMVMMVIGIVTCGIGFILALPLWLAEVIFSIVGGQHASKGEWYRYPFNIRMVK